VRLPQTCTAVTVETVLHCAVVQTLRFACSRATGPFAAHYWAAERVRDVVSMRLSILLNILCSLLTVPFVFGGGITGRQNAGASCFSGHSTPGHGTLVDVGRGALGQEHLFCLSLLCLESPSPSLTGVLLAVCRSGVARHLCWFCCFSVA